MILFEKFILCFLASIDNYITRNYINKENAFTRKGKMTFKEYVYYILTKTGCNNYHEAIKYYTLKLSENFETISPQGIGKQRKYISSLLFRKLSESFIDKLYNEYDGFSRFKGYIVTACDGSIFDLPVNKKTRKEFDIPDDTLFNFNRVRARVSCIMDVNSRFILTTEIVSKNINEITLALMHFENLQKRGFNLSKMITIFDRGYNSIELMLTINDWDSKFLIRLRKNIFNKQINKIKDNDGFIEINMTKSRLNRIRNEKLRKKAEEMGRLKLRVVKVKLSTGEYELLVTNLNRDEFSTEDLKELYGQRWEIETGYKKLKRCVQIEKFSGFTRIIIEQDFFTHIFNYNLANAIYFDAKQQIKRETRNDTDDMEYKPNFSAIIGNIYLFFYHILTKTLEIKAILIKFIIRLATLELIQRNRNKEISNERNKNPDTTNNNTGYNKPTY